MDIGIQMYSLRDISQNSLEEALKKVAEIGYKSVEFAGFFGHPAETVKGWLDKYGLRVSGTHTMPFEFLEDFEAAVAYHEIIGNTDVIIPWFDLSTKENIDKFVGIVNDLKPGLAERGIALHYHNHDFEFLPNKDGLIPYDEITSRTDIMLEIDTYWAFAAFSQTQCSLPSGKKRDPIALLDQFVGRMKFYHLKDGLGGRDGKPLGMGKAPVKAVWAKAKELGLYPVVESETLTPDGPTEAEICFDYIKQELYG